MTDSLVLLQQAATGIAAATAARKPLAGQWHRIGAVLEAPLQSLVEDGHLLWMPSHTSCAAAVGKLMSNGMPITRTGWRANRLADAVAKCVAQVDGAAAAVAALLKEADAVVRHEAAVLGAVTHAANNHMVTVINQKGVAVTSVRRDATQATRTTRRIASEQAPAVRHLPSGTCRQASRRQTLS